MQLSNSGVNRLTWWAVGGAPNFTLQEDSIRTSWMDGHVLQGVPAALQPVHEHARDGHRQNARLHRNHAPSLASPAPPCPQTFLQVRRAKTTHGQHDSPVTCAPVGGQHPAQCMAGRPPPKGGSQCPGRGIIPRPSTPSCAVTSNCRTECTSHSSASSSPAAGVEYFHAQTV